jgi:hypothetical protein
MMTRLRVRDSVMIMKIVLVAVGTLLPILANAGIRYETTQQQTVLQETLTKMCPMVWANIDTVQTMPEYQQIRQWCPET